MYSASSPLPVLLLSSVVGDIHEGCYLLHRAGLLQSLSHLVGHRGQYRKKQFVDVFNKTSNIPEQVPFLITYIMTSILPCMSSSPG